VAALFMVANNRNRHVLKGFTSLARGWWGLLYNGGEVIFSCEVAIDIYVATPQNNCVIIWLVKTNERNFQQCP
jgi:hypothetical protein